MDVLDVNIFGQVGNLLRVELVPGERETRETTSQLGGVLPERSTQTEQDVDSGGEY